MNSLKEYQNKVSELISLEQWAEAYRITNEILKLDPDNSQFNKFKRIIEKAVTTNNKKAIKVEIKNLEPLLAEGNYEEYLRRLNPLQSYVNDYPEIAQLLLKAKKAFDQKLQTQAEQSFQEQFKSIQAQPSPSNYQDSIAKLGQLLKLGLHKEQIENYILKLQKEWQEKELTANIGLIKSQKYEDKLLFLLKLDKILPNTAKIQSLISNTKRDYQYFKIENQKDYIFKTLEEVKILFITKSYDKSIILCERLLSIDPKNQQALSYMKRSTISAEAESSVKVEEQILENYKTFNQSKDYLNKNFIKI